jgi:hypothetical protein
MHGMLAMIRDTPHHVETPMMINQLFADLGRYE